MTTPRKRHRPLSHSAREQFKACNQQFALARELRLEPLEKKKSLRMGTAFGLCIEHRDPERAYEGYWENIPLHERIMDREAQLEIAQVKLLAELYLVRYAGDTAPGRIWTPEFEFKSKVLGHGFLDAIIEERNGHDDACPVHGQVRGRPGNGLLDLDGSEGGTGLRRDERGRPDAVRTPDVVRALPGTDPGGLADPSRVPDEGVLQSGSPASGDARREPAGGDEGHLPARARVDGGEHVHARTGSIVSGVQPGEGAAKTCCCPTLRIGMEGKLLQKGLFWNDTSRLVLAIDDQVTAYFAAMREIGRPLDKLLYRVTFKPGITQNSKTKETLEAYLDRLKGRIAEDPSYAFEEHELYRTDAQLDRFLEECTDVNEQVKLARRRGAWPKNTKSCTAFGGCVFLPVCREETGALDNFRIKPEPAPKPKLPRLGKVQKAVLLAMGDSFTEWVELVDIARQSGTGRPSSSLHAQIQSLVKRGFVERASADGDDPAARTSYRLTSTGRDAHSALSAAEEK